MDYCQKTFGGGHLVYLPGVLPQSFSEGDEVKLKVNKVTSPKSLLAMDYYHFPFCQPEGGPQRDSENLGEFLSGDRIESSPYKLHMKEDINCEQLCVADLGDPIGARKNKKSFWKEMSRKEKRKFMEAKKKEEKRFILILTLSLKLFVEVTIIT